MTVRRLILIIIVQFVLFAQEKGFIYAGAGPFIGTSTVLTSQSELDLDTKLFYFAGLTNQIENWEQLELHWASQVQFYKLVETRIGRIDNYSVYYWSLKPILSLRSGNFLYSIKPAYNLLLGDSYSDNAGGNVHPFPSEQLTDFKSGFQLDLSIALEFSLYRIELTYTPIIHNLVDNSRIKVQQDLHIFLSFFYSI